MYVDGNMLTKSTVARVSSGALVIKGAIVSCSFEMF